MQGWLLETWDQISFNLIEGQRYKMILNGLSVTIQVALSAAGIGMVLGFIIALMRLSNARLGKWHYMSWFAGVYIEIIRGTPLVLQLLIMNFIILAPYDIPKIFVGIITFGLNSGAYVSEMVRGGILSVDKGQTEAGRSLGLSSWATMRLIIIPQTFKIILPSLTNEFIMLLKETSILGMIAVMDLTKAGDYIRSRTYSAFLPYFIVAAIYLVMVSTLTRVFARVERRLRQGDLH